MTELNRLSLDSGLTLCRVPSPRSPVVHRLVCTQLANGADTDRSYWIDAGNVASTHALYECASNPRSLRSLRVARAFTAYQHHSLVRTVAREAGPQTGLIVAPNVADRYRDGDLESWDRADLLASTLTTLDELGRVLECPVLVTTAAADVATTIREYADRVLEFTRTREGVRFVLESPDEERALETMGYWHGAYWQTTIPYWVDVCGVADDAVADTIDPAVDAHDRGLLEVSA